MASFKVTSDIGRWSQMQHDFRSFDSDWIDSVIHMHLMHQQAHERNGDTDRAQTSRDRITFYKALRDNA